MNIFLTLWHKVADRWRGREPRLRPAGPPNPFEAFLLAICVLQGALVLFGVSRPTSIANAMPHFMLIVWASMLLGGGAVALAGLFWPADPFTGAEVKRVGLIAIGFASLAYGLALAGLGASAYLAASSNLAFAAASLVRFLQVGRALRNARIRISKVGIEE